MTTNDSSTFFGLGLAPRLLDMLAQHKFSTPTPIQMQTIPLAIEGKDVVGIAQTGTGKTLAFGLPMMQNIARQKTYGLILVPTRELASQVDEVLMQFGKSLGLKTAVIVGGASMNIQKRALQKKPHIIIATPGRLIDHLSQGKKLLQNIGILTLDEADRMLDMGFAPQIEKILAQMPAKRQTLLFSATMPETIMTIAKRHMNLPLRIEISKPGTTVQAIQQEVIFLEQKDKQSTLKKLLSTHSGSILIFSRTKWGAKKLANTIRVMGYTSTDISSNKSLPQRKAAIDGFKNGRHRILVATDIAARGIDVSNIEVVINYDVPSTPDDYVHRIGRTARAGKRGLAITFATPDQMKDVRDIERLIRMPLAIGAGSIATTSQKGKTPSQNSYPKKQYSHRNAKKSFRQKKNRNSYFRNSR